MRYQLDKQISNGCWKQCWTIKGFRSRVALVMHASDYTKLNDEHEQLEKLRAMGLPVLQTWGVDLVRDPYGKWVHAIIARRMKFHSKGNCLGDAFEANLNDQSVKDFDLMMEIFKRENIYINDIQFLANEDGHVVICDPLGIENWYSPYGLSSWKHRAERSSERKRAAITPAQPAPQ